jgi:hypothetical protein
LRPADDLLRALLHITTDDKCDILRRFLNAAPCMFAALTLCREDALLARLDHIKSTDDESSAALLARLFVTMAFDLTRKLIETIAQIGAVDDVDEALAWYLQLLAHSIQSGSLTSSTIEIRRMLCCADAKNIELFERLNVLSPRIFSIWLRLFNVIEVCDERYWTYFLSTEIVTNRRLALILYADIIVCYLMTLFLDIA